MVKDARRSLRFVVQEHHARQLHYDFRLEMADVLKSWAIPKGPSMTPADKRLAVMVEDHPLDYFDYEGIIPEGQYGAGTVVIWDTADYELIEGQDPVSCLKKGKIIFELKGNILKGGFSLIKMKGRGDKNWLLIKKRDQHSQKNWVLEEALTEAKMKTLKEKAPPCEEDVTSIV